MKTGTQKQCLSAAGASASRNRWVHCLSRAILLALLAASPGLPAQDATAPGLTNEVTQADDSSTSDTSQTGEARDEEMTETNSVAGTNQPANPGPDARTRRINRRRAQNRPRSNGPTGAETRSGSPGTNAGPASLDYSAFRLVVERNIFDPNRSPRSARPAAQPKTVDAFTLVGTMSYEKGVFAFFDSSSSDFKKVLKPQDTIAGYKLISISPDSVKLMQNTNVIELSVGSQMRRREDGSWERSASSESYVAASTSGSSKESSSNGAENDVIKKMMQRREKE
jgi:hypothetical protein